MRCEFVLLLSQDLESGLLCCQVPECLLAMCLEFAVLELLFFWCIPVCFLRFSSRGQVASQMEAGNDAASYWGWEAFAFWVLRELRAGRGIYPHEQNIVVSASRDTLNFSVFLCLLSWLLVCSALILGHFLGRMEIWVLLCPTWSDLPAGHGAAVGCGGTGELRAKMPTVFLLLQLGCWALWAKRWLSLQTPAFNEHDHYCAPLCMECWWLRTVHWRGGGNLWTQLTHK